MGKTKMSIFFKNYCKELAAKIDSYLLEEGYEKSSSKEGKLVIKEAKSNDNERSNCRYAYKNS